MQQSSIFIFDEPAEWLLVADCVEKLVSNFGCAGDRTGFVVELAVREHNASLGSSHAFFMAASAAPGINHFAISRRF